MGITVKNNKPVTKNMTIKGDDGVGIKTITSGTPVITEEKTTTPITVTLTDETTQNFNVEAQNGSGGGTGGKKYFHYISLTSNSEDITFYFTLVSTAHTFTSVASIMQELPSQTFISCMTGKAPFITLTELPLTAFWDGKLTVKFIELGNNQTVTKEIDMTYLALIKDNVVEL